MDHPPDGFDFFSQQALNILASQATRNASHAVVLAGGYLLGREIQRRLSSCEVIWVSPGGSCTSGNKVYRLSKRGKLVDAGNAGSGNRRALILACPLGEGDDDGFSESLLELPSYRNLYGLAYGWLSRLAPEWQFLRTSLSGVGGTRTRIRQAGWVVDNEIEICGPGSIAWGYLAKWWVRLGRQDLADRYYYAMREALINMDASAGVAVFVVICAKRSMRVWPMAIHEEIHDYTSMVR